ncbi:hypothetical protein SNE40_004686 [Patella caerulea]|uniref:Fibrinogen C-terminal domain-containing protein n=1 Tax=Patella caerulea TaxID=87958 RepID=A0AAN8K3J2_PATCE
MDLSNGYLTNLLTYIQPDITPVEVVCMYGYRGTMAFMHRDNSCVFEDFNRTMEEYSNGFGPVPRNRWVGLVTMFHIMKQPTKHWTIIFRSKRANFFKTYYYNVTCQDATLGYELNFATSGHGGGGCGSCMQELRGNRFSTFDQDNTGANNCVRRFGGGWWFDNDTDCTVSFLTGPMDGPDENNHLIDAPPSSEPFMYLQIQLQRYL